jgi:hypothetical protein
MDKSVVGGEASELVREMEDALLWEAVRSLIQRGHLVEVTGPQGGQGGCWAVSSNKNLTLSPLTPLEAFLRRFFWTPREIASLHRLQPIREALKRFGRFEFRGRVRG